MMYSSIVRRKIEDIFEQVNRRNYAPMLDSLAPSFSYKFHGDHALGGCRTSKEAMARWWERVFRLLPDLKFELQDVLVSGWPWQTKIAIRAGVHGSLPGQTIYNNTMFQIMELRWGKVVKIETIENLQILEQALAAAAEAGASEAQAPPIAG